MKRFSELKVDEILSLAISSEDEDAQIYQTFAKRLKDDYPATAQMFVDMAEEERKHKKRLVDMYEKKFGQAQTYVTRQDVRGFMKRRPIWLLEKLRIEAVRRQVAEMEIEAANFYKTAAAQTTDPDVKRLLQNLALAEEGHEAKAEAIEHQNLTTDKRAAEDAMAKRLVLLQIVQPGLSGLIDGSVSSLAPIFAAAFATHNSSDALLVGLAASIGSGISMGLTEALSDDGAISGRGKPWVRGLACGLMTAAGGLGHALPYLITDFWIATGLAGLVVLIELWVISWIRWKFMDTPFGSAVIQVVLGGALVLGTGILIGSS